MAPYIRCITCNKVLGNRYPIYNKGIEEIYSNKSYSDEDKLNKKEELVNSLKLNSCCKMRLITTINKETILIT